MVFERFVLNEAFPKRMNPKARVAFIKKEIEAAKKKGDKRMLDILKNKLTDAQMESVVETVELDEAGVKDILLRALNKSTPKQIAKEMGLSPKVVKQIIADFESQGIL